MIHPSNHHRKIEPYHVDSAARHRLPDVTMRAIYRCSGYPMRQLAMNRAKIEESIAIKYRQHSAPEGGIVLSE